MAAVRHSDSPKSVGSMATRADPSKDKTQLKFGYGTGFWFVRFINIGQFVVRRHTKWTGRAGWLARLAGWPGWPGWPGWLAGWLVGRRAGGRAGGRSEVCGVQGGAEAAAL